MTEWMNMELIGSVNIIWWVFLALNWANQGWFLTYTSTTNLTQNDTHGQYDQPKTID
jgi:hypothetical protein